VEKAFAEVDRVFEDTFHSPPAQHVPMEPHVTLAYLDESQRINLWTATQTPLMSAPSFQLSSGCP
jgi:putative selenate reductase molybdopterin-binding subunit